MHPSLITTAVAIVTAILGTMILNAAMGSPDGHLSLPTGFLCLIIPASVLFWSYAGWLFRRRNAGVISAIAWGTVSPFMGGMLAGLPFCLIGAMAGLGIAVLYAEVVVPIGIATGLAVWMVNPQD